MRPRLPRKIKKGIRIGHRKTKWNRKAWNLFHKETKILSQFFSNPSAFLFEPGGIISDKPVSGQDEYVVSKDEAQRLTEMLKYEPESENLHATISAESLEMALKVKINKTKEL
jgi:hypothetical protein